MSSDEKKNEAQDLIKLGKLGAPLTCVECRAPFTPKRRPHIMRCGHVVCVDCALHAANSGGSLTCPIDKVVQPLENHDAVTALPEDFSVMAQWEAYVDLVSKVEGEPVCQHCPGNSCQGSRAISFCLSCAKLSCGASSQPEATTELKTHDLVALSELKRVETPGDKLMCGDHDLPLIELCNHCDKFVCAKCSEVEDAHPEPRVPLPLLAAFLVENIGSIKLLMTNIKHQCSTLELPENETDALAVSQNANMAKSAINGAFDAIIAHVNSERDRMLAVVDARVSSIEAEAKNTHPTVTKGYLDTLTRIHDAVLSKVNAIQDSISTAGGIPTDKAGIESNPQAPSLVECQALAGVVTRTAREAQATMQAVEADNIARSQRGWRPVSTVPTLDLKEIKAAISALEETVLVQSGLRVPRNKRGGKRRKRVARKPVPESVDGKQGEPEGEKEEDNRDEEEEGEEGEEGATDSEGSDISDHDEEDEEPWNVSVEHLESEEETKERERVEKELVFKDPVPEPTLPMEEARRRASEGDVEAYVILGNKYEHGVECEVDYDEAMKWYMKAVDKDDPEGMCCAAALIEIGKGATQDVEKAFQLFKRAAEHPSKHGRALCCVGVCYDNGTGVEADPAEAIRWYERGREVQHAKSIHYLAMSYEAGTGCESNFETAAKYYLEAALLSFVPAIIKIGIAYERGIGVDRDPYKAVAMYRRGVKLGSSRAALMLANCYADGNGVPHFPTLALKVYKRVAELASDVAVAGECLLKAGLLYRAGVGVKRNFARAAGYFEASIERKFAPAYSALGVLYESGRGVPQSLTRALDLYNQGAALGDVESMCCLGVLYCQESSISPVDYDKAIPYLKSAMEKGHSRATHILGVLSERGTGMPQSNPEALKYYELAASRGSTDAINRLVLAYKNGDIVPKDLQKAKEYCKQVLDETPGARGMLDSIEAEIRASQE